MVWTSPIGREKTLTLKQESVNDGSLITSRFLSQNEANSIFSPATDQINIPMPNSSENLKHKKDKKPQGNKNISLVCKEVNTTARSKASVKPLLLPTRANVKILSFSPKSQRLSQPCLYEFDIYLRAATEIQRVFKGYLCRKKWSFKMIKKVLS